MTCVSQQLASLDLAWNQVLCKPLETKITLFTTQTRDERGRVTQKAMVISTCVYGSASKMHLQFQVQNYPAFCLLLKWVMT